MVFSSEIFIFLFFPIVFIGYYLLPKKLKNIWLLIFSLVFYSWNNYKYLFLLLLNIFINYIFALIIQQVNKKYKKIILVVGITINLLALIYFKYFNFLLSVVNDFFNKDILLKKIILPIGISFYTFQGISYLIDVYRKDVKAQKNIITFSLYLSFFPQLVAGPIVRYKDIENNLNKRENTLENICIGLKRFIIGLSKKVILADSASIIVDSIWNLPSTDLTRGIAWIGIIYYSFQIYYDFSGYSDMAIGLGKMFGFDFLENFNFPYISKSISEFWRRWHMSLSGWFKDYIYIPLGGNKKNVYRNILIVFILTGVWHGAGWTFIIWGLWHGIFNLLEKLLKDKIKLPKKIYIKICRHIYVLLVILIGWVFFRASTLEDAITFLKAMFFDSVKMKPGYQIWWFLNKYNIVIGIISIIFCTPILKKIYTKITDKCNENLKLTIEYIITLFLLIVSIIQLISSNYHPFIYFQF